MTGPSVVMHRRPVAAVSFDFGHIGARAVLVICNDGAVFELDVDAGERGAWVEAAPVPGTERVAVKQAEEENPRPRKAPN